MEKRHGKSKTKIGNFISGIYALLDPRTGDIRYIGQSKNISKRFSSHKYSSSDYPVSKWISKLRKDGLIPDLVIIEEHENPVDVEKQWIDRAKKSGANLLNLHEGGRFPSQSLNGTGSKIWLVNGMPTPYLMLIRSHFAMIKNSKAISDVFKGFSDRRKACISEEEFVDFEICMARACHESQDDNLVAAIENWLINVADKINAKYPGKIVLRYADE